jgi:hypothetical protein
MSYSFFRQLMRADDTINAPGYTVHVPSVSRDDSTVAHSDLSGCRHSPHQSGAHCRLHLYLHSCVSDVSLFNSELTD